MQLIKHPRFQNEYKTWNDKINKISEKEIKNDLVLLLNRLVSEVKKVDMYTFELSGRNGVDASLNETRQNITDLRRKISKRLQDCEAAGLIN